MPKYPMTSTRMRRDALALKRAVAALTSLISASRADHTNTALQRAVVESACEVERLSTCLRADALNVQSAITK